MNNKIFFCFLFFWCSILGAFGQNTGISIANPQATLDVNGEIKVDDLQGPNLPPSVTGGRHGNKVYSDSDGKLELLFAGVPTKKMYLSPATFATHSEDAIINGNQVRSNGVTSTAMFAPVHLPDYAQINGFEASIYDNSTTSNIAVRLVRSDGPDGANITNISTLTSFGNSASVQTLSDAAGNWSTMVFNVQSLYYLRIEPATGSWDNSNLRLYGVTIHYKEI